MLIREECASDDLAINDLTIRAFKPMSYSDGTEAQIIRLLRQSGHLTLSLVAEEDGAIIGHVAFSPITIDGAHDGWFGLGPIAVEPTRQRSGIGRALILKGLEALKGRGAVGVALIGDPIVYSRVGFESDGLLSYRDIDRRFVQRLVFSGPIPNGELRFADAFERGGNGET
jgi:putative acetyltransferase